MHWTEKVDDLERKLAAARSRIEELESELKSTQEMLTRCQRNNDFHIKEWTRAEVENKYLRQERDNVLAEKQRLRDFILAIQASTEDPVTENHCKNKLKSKSN